MSKCIVYCNIILVFLVSCNNRQQENCDIDLQLREEFFNCIDIVKISVNGKSTDSFDRAFAFSTLDLLTSQQGLYMPNGDSPYLYDNYENNDLSDKDLKRWLE